MSKKINTRCTLKTERRKYFTVLVVLLLITTGCKTNKPQYTTASKDKTKSKTDIVNYINPKEIFLNKIKQGLKPRKIININTSITDAVIYEKDILLSSGNGKIIRLSKGKSKTIIDRPDRIIFSLDKNSSMTAWTEEVSTEKEGTKSKLILKKDNSIQTLIDGYQKFYKVRFIDKDNILITLLTSEVILFSISQNKIIYKKQLSKSVFSDLDITKNKKKAVLSNEGGQYIIFDTASGEVLKLINGLHKDRILSINMRNNYIVSGGQDRRLVIYNINDNNAVYINMDFIVNKIAINKNKIAFPLNEANDIAIFDINASEITHLLPHKSLISSLTFIGNRRLITTSEDGLLYIWDIP